MTLNVGCRRDWVKTNGVLRPDAYADGRRGVVPERVREHGDIQLMPDGTALLKRELRGKVTWVVVP